MKKPRSQAKAEQAIDELFAEIFSAANNILDIAKRFEIPPVVVQCAQGAVQAAFMAKIELSKGE